MKNFEWQTDEDEARPFSVVEAGNEGSGGWFGRKLGVLLFVLTLIGAAVYWQLDRQADARTAVYEADVLAVFKLWQQAVAQGDDELFNTLLTGSHPGWAASQRNQFHAGLVMNRTQLDLALAADEERLQVANVAVTLSPDWTAAEISFEQVYHVIDHPAGELSPPREVRLGQVVAFERNADRWFLAQPPGDFWGEQQSVEKTLLSVSYPERDEEWALRLAQDLEVELSAVCRRLPAGECSNRETIELRLDTNAANPVLSNGWEPTLVDGRVFIIPAFSLVGRPVDEAGYDYLYRFYTRPILDIFSSWVDTPIPLPDQELQLICYPPEARSPRLVRFTSPDDWVVDLPEQSFRYLSATANDDALILQQYLPGEAGSGHLRLLLWQDGRERVVYDDTFNHLMLYPVGWGSPPGAPHLMLHGFDANPTFTSYSYVDLDDCDAGGCRVDVLEGFPVWSPDGRRSILQQAGMLVLGDENAVPQEVLGSGVGAFWLDNERFGYLRYLPAPEGSLVSSRAEARMEIVTAEIGSGDSLRLVTTDDFAPDLSESRPAPRFFNYVTTNPADPNELYVALRSYEAQRERLNVYSVTMVESAGGLVVDTITAELGMDDSAIGYPSLFHQNGFVPFVVSADGRWISTSSPAPGQPDTWHIYARDTELNQTHQYAVEYPSWMFIHPYYDWSKDGSWLVIVEQNYLRLIAPAYNYERLISHELQNCSHVAWVDVVE